MKTMSFSFIKRYLRVSFRDDELWIEDCPSLDAAPVPAYWLLRQR
jgi:hypothetical protein